MSATTPSQISVRARSTTVPMTRRDTPVAYGRGSQHARGALGVIVGDGQQVADRLLTEP